MNGVLVVDKPAGPSSHDVVARVRRATGVDRIGHTGTLDPLATGVLPLVVGRATRLAQFLSGADKEYVAEVRFGFATATYDAQGEPVPPAGDDHPVPGDLAAALLPLLKCESYEQMPPPFSAKKVGGIPAYELARRNKPVALKPVAVTIREIELLGCAGDIATIRVVCSSGFYVRTLAHELGRRLGCGAHLAALRRTRAGDFTLAQAVPLEALEGAPAEAASRLLPIDALLPALPKAVVNARGAERVMHGNALSAADLEGSFPPVDGPVRILDGSARLLGIAKPRGGAVLQPIVVLV